MSDIRDWGAFIRGRWNWTSYGYEAGFPRGSQFGDVDAVVEFDGRTLYVETKAFDGLGDWPQVPLGQYFLLERLARQANTAVFVLFGCGVCNDPKGLLEIYADSPNHQHDWRALPLPERRAHLKHRIDSALGLTGDLWEVS